MTAPVYAPARRRQTGFTLIELLVVVAIIGLLAGVGIPQYQKYVERAAVTADLASVQAFRTAVDAAMFDVDVDNTAPNAFAGLVGLTNTEANGNPKITGVELKPNKKATLTRGDVRLARDKDGDWTCTNKNTAVDLKGCAQGSF